MSIQINDHVSVIGGIPLKPVLSSQKLLKEIDEFLAPCPVCGHTNMTASWFTQQACGNGHLVERLRKGGSVHVETAERIRAFMKAHKYFEKAHKFK